MKLCNTCELFKDESKFHKRKESNDGLSAKCKTCQKVYDKLRATAPHRKLAREIYAQTEQGRLAGNKSKAAYAKRNPEKIKAHSKVLYHIRAGNLVPQPCEQCGTENNIHAHHDDYSKPLNVRWLCVVHHKQYHAKLNREAT